MDGISCPLRAILGSNPGSRARTEIRVAMNATNQCFANFCPRMENRKGSIKNKRQQDRQGAMKGIAGGRVTVYRAHCGTIGLYEKGYWLGV